MKKSFSIVTLYCLLSTAASAATFPSVYEPRRLTVEEGIQILGPANVRGDDFGGQVSPLGDINGDSLIDFAIGLVDDPLGVLVLYGSATLASTQIEIPSIHSTGTLVPGRVTLAGVGDFNGDGLDDWIINNHADGATLVLGQREAYPMPLYVSQPGKGQWVPITRDGVGYSYSLLNENLIPAGDINGDGYDDILAWSDAEKMVILQRRAGLLPDRLELSEVPGNLQSTVRPHLLLDTYRGGDINGDGFADVLFDDYSDLHVVFGSAAGLPSDIDLSLLNGVNGFSIDKDEAENEPDSAGTRSVLGYLSRIVDDITGDGVDDLLIVSRSSASSSAGKIQLLAGHSGLWNAKLTLTSPEITDGASYETTDVCTPVRAVGDINADGINDWLAGLCEQIGVVYGREKGGEVLSLDRLDGISGFHIKPTAESDRFVAATGAQGDINGDGIDDLLLGSPHAYLPVVNLDDLIEQPYPFGSSDQTGLVSVVFGRPELGEPASPNGLYPALGPGFIQLRWELAPQQQASAFDIHRDGALIDTVAGDATGYIDATAQRDLRHTYEVVTVDEAGVRSSPLVLSTKNNLTRYPEISGAVYSSKLAEIFWVFDHLNYDIYRDGKLVDSAMVSSWMDRDYDPAGHTYYVEAEMLLYQQHRARSALLTLPEYTDGRPPAPVDNLHFAVYSGTTLELFWEHASWGEAPLVYEITRNQNVIATVDGTSWMDYNVHVRGDYEITTIDASGRRSRAQLLNLSMYDELPKIRPSMPDKLSASVLDNQSIELEWTLSSIGTPATRFKVYRSGVKIGTTTTTRYIDSEAVANTRYRYEVVAYNDDGQRSESARVDMGVSLPVAPAPPTSAFAIAYGSHTVEVFWSRAASGQTPAARYELYRNGSLIDTIDALSYMDRDLSPGTEYEYNIRSVSAFGISSADAASAIVTTPSR